MGTVLYGILSMALVYCWLIGGVHSAIMIILGTYVALHGMIIAEVLRRHAIRVGWSGQSLLSFLLTISFTGFAAYIILVS